MLIPRLVKLCCEGLDENDWMRVLRVREPKSRYLLMTPRFLVFDYNNCIPFLLIRYELKVDVCEDEV